MTATEDKSYYIARTKLAEYLDNRRLRKTPERFAILEAVFSHNDHFGIEALYVDMENRAYHVSRSTIYNTMELFTECGLVRKHQFGTNQAVYEKVVSSGNHHHLICTECGKTECIDICPMNKIYEKEAEKRGFLVTGHVFEFYGICWSCRSKAKK